MILWSSDCFRLHYLAILYCFPFSTVFLRLSCIHVCEETWSKRWKWARLSFRNIEIWFQNVEYTFGCRSNRWIPNNSKLIERRFKFAHIRSMLMSSQSEPYFDFCCCFSFHVDLLGINNVFIAYTQTNTQFQLLRNRLDTRDLHRKILYSETINSDRKYSNNFRDKDHELIL